MVGHPAALESAAGRSRSVHRAPCLNAASVIRDGQILQRYAKRELPNYQVFDERRYFVPGDAPCVFEVENGNGSRVKVGLLICEDAWFEQPAADARAAGAELLAVINASPFHAGKGDEREAGHAAARAGHRPAAGLRAPGRRPGRDRVRGPQFRARCDGALAARASSFVEELFSVTLQSPAEAAAGPSRFGLTGPIAPEASLEADLWNALVLGVRDYVGKRTVSRRCWACRAASTRRWCWRSRSMRWAPTRCARS